jgi:hypothetical protein
MFKKLKDNFEGKFLTIPEFCLLVIKECSIEEVKLESEVDPSLFESYKTLTETEQENFEHLARVLTAGSKNSLKTQFASPYRNNDGHSYQIATHDIYESCYKPFELIDYILSQYHGFPFEITNWVNAYILRKNGGGNNAKDLPSTSIDTTLENFPKLIQLAINIHKKASSLEHINNNGLIPIFIETAKELGFPTEELPEMKTDRHGKNNLDWPKFKSYNSVQLTEKVFDVIIKQAK